MILDIGRLRKTKNLDDLNLLHIIIGRDGHLGQLYAQDLIRPIGYEMVYLPLCKVADTPFHIQGDGMSTSQKNHSDPGFTKISFETSLKQTEDWREADKSDRLRWLRPNINNSNYHPL